MKNKLIFFFTEDIRFTLRNKKKIRKWIWFVFFSEKKQIGTINYIFCSDKYLHEINLSYLNHDTLTDIITFDTSIEKINVSGDIFISIDRIVENSKLFHSTFYLELHRVMIHGILHLIGYNDKSPSEIELMHKKEDYYLSLLPNFIIK